MALDSARWKKLRKQILARDCYTCNYCGGVATEVDHIIPRVLGGDDNEDNLTAACMPCNRSKGARMAPKSKQNDFLKSPFPLPSNSFRVSPMKKLKPPEFGDNNE